MHFQRIDPMATVVFVEPGFPKIVAAYSKAGIPVSIAAWRVDERAPEQPAVPVTAYLPTSEPRAAQGAVEIPPDWQSLTWQGLRRLAASMCDVPVLNKTQAIEIITNELKRREGLSDADIDS